MAKEGNGKGRCKSKIQKEIQSCSDIFLKDFDEFTANFLRLAASEKIEFMSDEGTKDIILKDEFTVKVA